MKKEEVKNILNNAERIGRWENKDFISGDEELYLMRGEEDPDGNILCQFYLYGSDGINSLNWITKGIDLTNLDCGEKVLPISSSMARMWAARFLADEAYEKLFGKTTALQKVINNLSSNDLNEMFVSALECRTMNYSKEAFVSDYILGGIDIYPGMAGQGLCELLRRMWDFTCPEIA